LFAEMRKEGFIRRGLELHLEVVNRVDAILPAIRRALVPLAKEEAEARITAKF
jgi:hypothetical protein